MIRARMEDTRLEITGHAGCAPAGRDILCAGVSALTCALAARCREIALPGEISAIVLEPGRAVIRLRPGQANRPAYREAFDTVKAGLALMAKHYPEHMRLEIPDDHRPRKEQPT